MENNKYGKWVSTKLEEEDYDALQYSATEHGIHLVELMNKACQYFIEHCDEEESTTVGAVRKFYLQSRSRQLMLTQLKQLALIYKESRATEDMLILEKACQAAGVDLEVILELVPNGRDDEDEEVISNAKGINAAVDYILSMLPPGVSVPSAKFKEMAESVGFKWTTIQHAKRKLRQIKAIRKDDVWHWQNSGDILEEVEEMMTEK